MRIVNLIENTERIAGCAYMHGLSFYACDIGTGPVPLSHPTVFASEKLILDPFQNIMACFQEKSGCSDLSGGGDY